MAEAKRKNEGTGARGQCPGDEAEYGKRAQAAARGCWGGPEEEKRESGRGARGRVQAGCDG